MNKSLMTSIVEKLMAPKKPKRTKSTVSGAFGKKRKYKVSRKHYRNMLRLEYKDEA